MFVIMLVTKSGSTFANPGTFSSRQAASTYAASALRGTLCARKSRIKGYTIVNIADQRTTREANDAQWAGRS